MDRSICRQLLSFPLLAALLAPCNAAADDARYTLTPDERTRCRRSATGQLN